MNRRTKILLVALAGVMLVAWIYRLRSEEADRWREAVRSEDYVNYAGWAGNRIEKWHFRLFTPIRAHLAEARGLRDRRAALQLESALEARDLVCLGRFVRHNANRQEVGGPLLLEEHQAEAERIVREAYQEAQQRFAALPKHRGTRPEGAAAIQAMLAYIAEHLTEASVDVVFRDIEGVDAVEGAELAWGEGFKRREARSNVEGSMRARLSSLFPGLFEEDWSVAAATWFVHTEVLRSEEDVVIVREGSQTFEGDRVIGTVPTFDVRFRYTLAVPDVPQHTFESIVRPDPQYEWESASATALESERFTFYQEMMARAHYQLAYELQIAYGLASPEREKKSEIELLDEMMELVTEETTEAEEDCPL